jgi:hypothetical protein
METERKDSHQLTLNDVGIKRMAFVGSTRPPTLGNEFSLWHNREVPLWRTKVRLSEDERTLCGHHTDRRL